MLFKGYTILFRQDEFKRGAVSDMVLVDSV
jgi:hypothetical protein